jgi:septal ring factor EnvC (AmiA/AmiB activator)
VILNTAKPYSKSSGNDLCPTALQTLKVYGFLFGLTLMPYTIADDQQQLKLDVLQSNISELQKTLTARNKQQTDLETDLERVETEASILNTSIRKLSNNIKTVEKQLIGKQKEKANLEINISRQNDAIIAQLRSAQKIGDQEPIKLLLNQEDPQKIARMFKYYDYFIQARSVKIEQYLTSVNALNDIIQSISRNKIDLVAAKGSLSKNQVNLKTNITQRENTLRKLQLAVANDEQKLANLKRQRRELETLLNEVETAVTDLALPANALSFTSRKGELEWPTKGRLAQRYGTQRNGSLQWQGWLIKVNAGAAVKTVHKGRIVFSNYLRGFGLLLIIDHGDGYMTLYGHNQELLKDTGDWVQTNEIIARAGSTGGLSAPALYFEIRSQGQPTNPKKWLQKS